jgi:hypothetical protein
MITDLVWGKDAYWKNGILSLKKGIFSTKTKIMEKGGKLW